MTEHKGYQQGAPCRKAPGRPDTGAATLFVELRAQD
jgi:hypothetical protein